MTIQVLDNVKILINTKPATLERDVMINMCIDNKPIINVLEHYGDNQAIYSHDNARLQQLSVVNRMSENEIIKLCG